MAELKDVQNIGYEIFKKFDKVCNENNLKYLMFAGTLLGAVRHKGYIPWDDDIDVYMPLKDYRKLCQVFNEEDFFLQYPKTNIQTPFIISKIRKNHTQMVEPGTEMLDIHQGIWLDVFIYVKAGKTTVSKKIQEFLRCLLQTYRCRYRYARKNNFRLFHWFFTVLPKSFQLWLDDFIIDMIDFVGSKKSDEYFGLSVGKNKFYKRSLFDNLSLYQFNDSRFYGIADYDTYLSKTYGEDYMIPKKWSHINDYSNVIVE